MLKRAKISVTRRKSKIIIFFLFLFIVANLVLSSISIKNATEESMKMARISLGSEVILQTDMEKIRDEFMNNKDSEQSTDENKKDDMKNMHNAMDESTATINDVNKLKEISYVTDVKYYFNVNATEKSFSLYESSKDDNNNDRPGFDKKMNSGLQVKAINTFKLEDNYVNGTIKLTNGEAFDETKDDTVIISYELATKNNLKVGDTIKIKYDTFSLEEKILADFKLSKFIVCTDAGLVSNANRKFNDMDERAFITTQSIKKLKKYLMDLALSPDEWHLSGDTKKYNINDIEKDEASIELYKDRIFFKERWINENGLEQKLIVTYSLKYKNYQRQIRNSQIERAKVAIANKCFKLDKCNQNDFKRFIKKTNVTNDGEIAEKKVLSLNTDTILKEEKFDGFYGVCTNLNDNAEEIIKVNQRRWKIEESFRIMKSEFKARPMYLSRDDRITAHFTTCFLSLVILRFLEKRLEEKYTSSQIINTL